MTGFNGTPDPSQVRYQLRHVPGPTNDPRRNSSRRSCGAKADSVNRLSGDRVVDRRAEPDPTERSPFLRRFRGRLLDGHGPGHMPGWAGPARTGSIPGLTGVFAARRVQTCGGPPDPLARRCRAAPRGPRCQPATRPFFEQLPRRRASARRRTAGAGPQDPLESPASRLAARPRSSNPRSGNSASQERRRMRT